MWKHDKMSVSGVILEYWAKVYDLPSQFGINEGRISKLTVTRDEEIILEYDRGWSIEPKDEIAQKALECLLIFYRVDKEN